MKTEVKIAKGKTLDEFEEDINRIANIREKEIRKQIDDGYVVDDFDRMHFRPSGPVSFENGLFLQIWCRKII